MAPRDGTIALLVLELRNAADDCPSSSSSVRVSLSLATWDLGFHLQSFSSTQAVPATNRRKLEATRTTEWTMVV